MKEEIVMGKIGKRQIIILILIVLLGSLCFIGIAQLYKSGVMEKIIKGVSRQEEIEKQDGISYRVYDNTQEKIKTLITITRKQGIDTIEYKDNENKDIILSCYHKEQVNMDLELEVNKEYSFKVSSGEDVRVEKIILQQDYIEDYIRFIDLDSEALYYKNMEIQYNSPIADIKHYYKIGEKQTNWTEYTQDIYAIYTDILIDELENEDDTVTIYAKQVDVAGNTIIASKTYKMNMNIANETIEAESLIKAVESIESGNGIYQITVNDETYTANVYQFDKSQTWSHMAFGNKADVAKAGSYANNMVIVKVNGDLTINPGALITAYANTSGYGGPKGMFMYCTGTLTNKGTISMTARGAWAVGQNVYLWANKNEAGEITSYEYVPKAGAAATGTPSGYSVSYVGNNGTGRRTGGGGSGLAYMFEGGAGAAGTSYSGGSGGSGASEYYLPGKPGAPNGGAGGASDGPGEARGFGGAGNPGQTMGSNGTGGLLILCAQNYINNGTVSSQGARGGSQPYHIYRSKGGGSSGSGSINIFYKETLVAGSTNVSSVAGGAGNLGWGGAGGAGTVTYTKIP